MEKQPLKARIDLAKASTVGEIQLGETVKVTLVGKVTEMRGPEEGLRDGYSTKGKKIAKEHYMYPGTVCVEFEKFDVEQLTEFSGMDDED